jgi:hypothetical protein
LLAFCYRPKALTQHSKATQRLAIATKAKKMKAATSIQRKLLELIYTIFKAEKMHDKE